MYVCKAYRQVISKELYMSHSNLTQMLQLQRFQISVPQLQVFLPFLMVMQVFYYTVFYELILMHLNPNAEAFRTLNKTLHKSKDS